MTKLGVNVDHVATIREARQSSEPDPVTAALLAELAGADGITVHLRGDRRHIRERDLHLLRNTITTRLNIEMAVNQEMIQIALEIGPDTVTLVPEQTNEITTEGGLDVIKQERQVAAAIDQLSKDDLEISLFIDPDHHQIERAAAIGTRAVELNTAIYSEAVPKGLEENRPAFRQEFDRVANSARSASSLGMKVLAGHGLTYRNVRPISSIPQVVELNIGHNIVARAVLVGMESAVRDMLERMNRAPMIPHGS